MPKRRCRFLEKDVLSVASDCTGLNAASLALESLSLPHQEEWVSDCDLAVRHVLAQNFAPKAILADAQNDLPNHFSIDFYSAGYPCQSFSRLGTQDGVSCGNGRVLLFVLKRIRSVKPRTFLLENVEDFQKKFKDVFDLTIDALKAIKDCKSIVLSVHTSCVQSRLSE